MACNHWLLMLIACSSKLCLFNYFQSISDHQIAEDLSEERKEEERNYFEVILANESIAEGGNFGKSEWVMLLAIIF